MTNRLTTVTAPDERSQHPTGTKGVATGAVSHWQSLSLEALAQLQGVGPVSDLDAIGALWPEDDDPDQLLEHILTERSARRKLSDPGDTA